MNCAVLFDGAGLARLGLEQAGIECVGVELNPVAHYLSTKVGSGNCVLGDATEFDLTGFDAVWASPPCQVHSVARTQGDPQGDYADDFLAWSLDLDVETLWVENVKGYKSDEWGTVYNAAQFQEKPLQNRQRVIGGRYPEPKTFRNFKPHYRSLDICPCITASEQKGYPGEQRRAARYYGRRLTIEECAYHQGFEIPSSWTDHGPARQKEFFGPPRRLYAPPWYDGTDVQWRNELYQAIGNGVPVYMAKAFGEAALRQKRQRS